MRFQVPQFIEVEDHIIGPLTLQQFVYLAGGAGLSFVIYTFLPIFIALPVIVIVIGFCLALAFYKINNKPFVNLLESAVKYSLRSKLYIWRKVNRKVEPSKETPESNLVSGVYIPKLSDSKLRDLTWSLDINEIMNPGTKETMKGKSRL